MKFKIYNFKFEIDNSKFLLLLAIIILASVLRFYKLNTNPPGLYWDEAVFGYDAYSILKTGRDHRGNFLPLFFESFGDWKLPVYHYLLVPSIAIFGANEFAVRFPSALFGTLTVLLTYLLVRELFDSSNDRSVRPLKKRSANLDMESPSLLSASLRPPLTKDHSRVSNLTSIARFVMFLRSLPSLFLKFDIPTLAALMLAISPWHLQFSRGGFEATAGLFFVVLGAYLFLLGIKNGKILVLTFSALSFVLSMYSYHAYRIFIPLLIISLIILNLSQIKDKIFKFIIPTIVSLVVFLPMLVFTFTPSGKARAISQSIFEEGKYENARVEYDQRSKRPLRFTSRYWSETAYNVNLALNNYFDHFSPIFLFFNGDQIGRHSQVDMGQIYMFEAVLIAIAIIFLIKHNNPALRLMLIWLLLAPIPAIIVKPTPHAYRTLQMAVPLAFFSAVGIWLFFSQFRFKIAKIILAGVIFYSFLTYIHLLFIHYPRKFSEDWQDGYRQMVQKVQKHQAGFEKIYITNINQVPYIYVLFYTKYDPQKFISQKGSNNFFDKYFFIDRDFNIYDKGRILYVAPSWEKVNGKFLDAVDDSAKRHIYSLWEVNGEN